ncbi:MAG TPA: L,D-transpeptidase [Terrimicrobiaceae bacterium]
MEGASKEGHPLSLFISTKEKILEVYSGEKLIAAFPVAVGSQQTRPQMDIGPLKESRNCPTFANDLKMLKEGERSSTFHLLPPGPSNPAGVIWIDLEAIGKRPKRL